MPSHSPTKRRSFSVSLCGIASLCLLDQSLRIIDMLGTTVYALHAIPTLLTRKHQNNLRNFTKAVSPVSAIYKGLLTALCGLRSHPRRHGIGGFDACGRNGGRVDMSAWSERQKTVVWLFGMLCASGDASVRGVGCGFLEVFHVDGWSY